MLRTYYTSIAVIAGFLVAIIVTSAADCSKRHERTRRDPDPDSNYQACKEYCDENNAFAAYTWNAQHTVPRSGSCTCAARWQLNVTTERLAQ